MADFKGTNYRKFAASALAPGQPLDTAVHHFIKNNNVYNFKRGDSVSIPLLVSSNSLTVSTGDRPHTSLDWSTVFIAPAHVGRRFDRVKVSGLIKVSDVGGGMVGPKPYHLRLTAFNRTAEVTLTHTDDRYVPFEIEVSGITSQSRHGQIILWGRGEVLDAPAPSPTDEYRGSRDTLESVIDVDWDTDMYRDEDGPQPAAGSLDLHVSAAGRADQVEFFDHVQSLSIEDPVSDQAPSGMVVLGRPSGTVYRPAIYPISFAQFKNLHIETGYRTDGLYNDAELRANIIERGEVAQNHNNIARQVVERPKHLSFGQGGVPNNGHASWPDGYRQTWTYVDSSAGDAVLAECGVVEDLSSRLTFTGLFIGAWFTHKFDGYLAGGNDADIGDEDNRIVRDVEIDIEVLQFQDGSGVPVVVGGFTRGIPISHLKAVQRPDISPFLQQQFWSRWGRPDSDHAWTYREGQLHAKDLRFIETVELDVPLNSFFIHSLPATIRVTARHSNQADPRFRTVLVGFSISSTTTI